VINLIDFHNKLLLLYIVKKKMLMEMEPLGCNYCKKKPQYFCGGCSSVAYCGKNCQEIDWQGSHRSICSKQHIDCAFTTGIITGVIIVTPVKLWGHTWYCYGDYYYQKKYVVYNYDNHHYCVLKKNRNKGKTRKELEEMGTEEHTKHSKYGILTAAPVEVELGGHTWKKYGDYYYPDIYFVCSADTEECKVLEKYQNKGKTIKELEETIMKQLDEYSKNGTLRDTPVEVELGGHVWRKYNHHYYPAASVVCFGDNQYCSVLEEYQNKGKTMKELKEIIIEQLGKYRKYGTPTDAPFEVELGGNIWRKYHNYYYPDTYFVCSADTEECKVLEKYQNKGKTMKELEEMGTKNLDKYSKYSTLTDAPVEIELGGHIWKKYNNYYYPSRYFVCNADTEECYVPKKYLDEGKTMKDLEGMSKEQLSKYNKYGNLADAPVEVELEGYTWKKYGDYYYPIKYFVCNPNTEECYVPEEHQDKGKTMKKLKEMGKKELSEYSEY
jgi:hypothetical protein